MIQGHKSKGRIDRWIHHRQVKAVLRLDGRPISSSRAAERIDPDPETRVANDLEIEDRCQIIDIRAGKIDLMRGDRFQSG
jgi:hypothetical protein